MSTVAYAQLTNMRDLATALVNARMRVALSVTDEGLPFVLGDVVDDDRAGQVPPSCRVTCSVLAICKSSNVCSSRRSRQHDPARSVDHMA
jgi:hypothetical protein